MRTGVWFVRLMSSASAARVGCRVTFGILALRMPADGLADCFWVLMSGTAEINPARSLLYIQAYALG
jgi:hypothetical protein